MLNRLWHCGTSSWYLGIYNTGNWVFDKINQNKISVVLRSWHCSVAPHSSVVPLHKRNIAVALDNMAKDMTLPKQMPFEVADLNELIWTSRLMHIPTGFPQLLQMYKLVI